MAVVIGLISLSIAYFGVMFIESDIKAYEVFGTTNLASALALGVGLFMSVMQVAFVFGGIAIAYINEAHK